jgi:CubicO group peptidase (beta-lactamase class C family)
VRIGRLVVLLAFACCAVHASTAVHAKPAERPAATPGRPALDPDLLAQALQRAAQLPKLQALLIARHGVIRAERRYHGPALDAPVNIKSISKCVISALVGIAIAEGKLQGVQQPIAPFFARRLERHGDPRLQQVTIGHLLSMQSGLARTSGPNYTPWVASRNWVEYILRQPMLADPGGPMIYSTGNSHLLSAILTKATGKSTLAYARARLAAPLGIELRPWQRDPQGVYFGGNQMRLSPRALVRFGELYRNGGRHQGRQVVPEAWVRESLVPRARSIFSGQLYGYGWFLVEIAGHPMFYAWGHGGQFVFVVPDLALTVVTTSAPDGPRDFEHLGAIHDILRETIIPAAVAVESDAT